MLKFLRNDGTKLRPFNSIEEHDETLISNWNSVVKPSDRVYHLGDTVINRRCLPTVKRLNGRIKLIRGNHDLFDIKDYLSVGFEDVYGCYVLPDLILSHIPLHPDCISTRFGTNVHGHLHSNEVMKPSPYVHNKSVIDTKYISVCCEHINYTPISIDSLRDKIKLRQG
jgi:calcineurin-like phosphoesterase family protein